MSPFFILRILAMQKLVQKENRFLPNLRKKPLVFIGFFFGTRFAAEIIQN